MRSPRLMIAMLVLATLLVDCVAITYTHWRRCPDGALILVWSLQLSQVSLMAIWLALGHQSGPWRLVGTVGVLIALGYVMSGLPDPSFEPPNWLVGDWLVMFAIQTVGISGPLLVARLLGLRVVDASADSGRNGSMAGPRRFQFSILYLLGWMTALAATLGTLKYFASFKSLTWGSLGAGWSYVLMVLLNQSAIALAALGAVLGTRRFLLSFAGLILFNLIGFALIFLFLGIPLYPPWSAPRLYLLYTLWLVASLKVFRVAGYRITWGNASRPAV